MSDDPSKPSDTPGPKKPSGGSQLILWGLVLGLVCGLTFGEYCRPLLLVGEGYVKLLQMTVMPYITVSLILGIGSLTAAQAKELARKAGALLLAFWVLSLLLVMLMPLSFPRWQSAAFFSSSLVEQPQQKNPLPQPGVVSVPLAYALARGDQELIDYVNAWIELKQKDGTTARLYDYWILGRGAVEKQPRWSLLRDVFHWVK